MTVPVTRRWSHSAFEDYSSCGEKFRLRRVEKVPQVPGVAQCAGIAFHEATEDYDRYGRFQPGAWPLLLEAAVAEKEEKSGYSRDRFSVSGRKTKDKPNKEDLTHWRDVLGPQLMELYAPWRDSCDLTIAEDLPQDGNGNTSGIEYEIVFRVGVVHEVGYVDRIVYDADGNLGVVDYKTGSRKPAGPQLPLYLLGLQKMGIPATWGAYYMARTGTLTEPVFYSSWDERKLASLHEQAAVMEAQGFYLPQPGEHCGWCSVKAHCQFAL